MFIRSKFFLYQKIAFAKLLHCKLFSLFVAAVENIVLKQDLLNIGIVDCDICKLRIWQANTYMGSFIVNNEFSRTQINYIRAFARDFEPGCDIAGIISTVLNNKLDITDLKDFQFFGFSDVSNVDGCAICNVVSRFGLIKVLLIVN